MCAFYEWMILLKPWLKLVVLFHDSAVSDSHVIPLSRSHWSENWRSLECHKDNNKSILMTFLLILRSQRKHKHPFLFLFKKKTTKKRKTLNLQHIAATTWLVCMCVYFCFSLSFFLESEHFRHSSKQCFHFLLPSEVDVYVFIYLCVSYV